MASPQSLEEGRRGHAEREWQRAYEDLLAADREEPLGPEDLERLATSAYMIGLGDRYCEALQRCHRAHLEAGDTLPAVRCAFWLGIHLVQQGETGRASGWLSRASRLLEGDGRDCPERGYLRIPEVFRLEATGEPEAAASAAAEATAIGERFGDRDLIALTLQQRGQILIGQGRIEEGLPLLDEAMLSATQDELSPIVTGIVYCGVILACQRAHEPVRAREWTGALARWCELQPEMVAFTGRCRLHRAEIMQLHGDWAEAMREATQAVERSKRAGNRGAAAEAAYRCGEVHRLRGELSAAERAYQQASASGTEPQPGMALLRLAQGKTAAATSSIRRALEEARGPMSRARLLPAFSEVMLAAGEIDRAREAVDELERTAAAQGRALLAAMAGDCRGAVQLATGDPAGALEALRPAWQSWEELEAPFEAARSRARIGEACRALGDEEAAALELEAAATALRELGAAPELARVESVLDGQSAGHRRSPGGSHGLTDRELEVLRLVAAGKRNRDIAAELVISEHTVARHVQNIFAKLGISSRAAAGAFAFEHGLTPDRK